jgi:surface polysaccharide O-acyltransferase-like enzyme
MVSGALYLSPHNKGSQTLFEEVLRLLKKILKILLVLLFWITVYKMIFPLYGIIKGRPLDFNIIKTIPRQLFGFPEVEYGHLWYLYMLIGLYLLTPVIRIFIRNCTKRHIEYFLVLTLFSFSLLVYNRVSIALNLTRMLPFLPDNIWFPVPELTGFIGYYVAGYYFANFEVARKTKNLIFFLGIISLIINIIGTVAISFYTGATSGTLIDSYKSPAIALMSYAVFILFKKVSINNFPRFKNAIILVGKNTFGIYLIHNIIISVVTRFGLNIYIIHPIISIPLISLLVFVASFLCSAIMMKIPLVKNVVKF